jgi:flagellin
VVAGRDTYPLWLADVRSAALGIGSIDIGATGDPAAAITALDGAITRVSTKRSGFGADLNTLTRTSSALDVQIENLSDANSRLVDVDLAAETADLVKNKLLQEAGIAVLAQANAQASIGLRLLQSL